MAKTETKKKEKAAAKPALNKVKKAEKKKTKAKNPRTPARSSFTMQLRSFGQTVLGIGTATPRAESSSDEEEEAGTDSAISADERRGFDLFHPEKFAQIRAENPSLRHPEVLKRVIAMWAAETDKSPWITAAKDAEAEEEALLQADNPTNPPSKRRLTPREFFLADQVKTIKIERPGLKTEDVLKIANGRWDKIVAAHLTYLRYQEIAEEAEESEG